MALAFAAGTAPPEQAAAQPAPTLVASSRTPRRGEYDCIKAQYRDYSDSELLALVYQIDSKRLKLTELKKLYDDNMTRVPPSAVEKVVYPKAGREARIKKLETTGLVPMGAPLQVSARTSRRACPPVCVLTAHAPAGVSKVPMHAYQRCSSDINGAHACRS